VCISNRTAHHFCPWSILHRRCTTRPSRATQGTSLWPDVGGQARPIEQTTCSGEGNAAMMIHFGIQRQIFFAGRNISPRLQWPHCFLLLLFRAEKVRLSTGLVGRAVSNFQFSKVVESTAFENKPGSKDASTKRAIMRTATKVRRDDGSGVRIDLPVVARV
jgi:hypothetical protein